MILHFADLGMIQYKEALRLQYQLHEKRQRDEIEDVVLLLEHPPVITMGVRGIYDNVYFSKEQLSEKGIDIVEVQRGGDVTFHGPGQLVGYPIMNLKDTGSDVKSFVEKMQNSIIEILETYYNIQANSEHGKYTGVWVGDEKIAAIGIEIKKWITMHGFAFNINTNLEYFNFINPCGLSKGVTSLEMLTGKKQDINRIKKAVIDHFARQYKREAKEISVEELLNPER